MHFFRDLTSPISNPTVSKISHWYINFWSSRISKKTIDMKLTLQSCRSLSGVLDAMNPSQIGRWDTLQSLCREVHGHLIHRYDSIALSLSEGAYISLVLNDLARSHNVSTKRPYVPDVDIPVIPIAYFLSQVGFGA